LTKSDKLHESKIEPLVAATLEQIKKRPAAFPEVIVTSSEKRLGLEALHSAIFKAIDFAPLH
jgi:GTP-binding protein